jgi:hypothetical protein
MGHQGWIKLWRKSKETAVFAHEGMWKLWCLCLMNASHKDTEVPISGLLKPVRLKPGQFITGRDSLHMQYHQGFRKNYRPQNRPVAKTIYRWLATLENQQMLSIKKSTKFSIITITNWPQYQEPVQQMSNRCPSNVHNQEEYKKKILSDEDPKPEKPKKTNPDIKRFIDFWCEKFQEKFEKKYTVNGKKEGTLVKRLLSTDTYEDLVGLAERFFESENQFIKEAGYTIGVFHSQINKLKTQDSQWYDQQRR